MYFSETRVIFYRVFDMLNTYNSMFGWTLCQREFMQNKAISKMFNVLQYIIIPDSSRNEFNNKVNAANGLFIQYA